ncbi:MAG: choice-of-anchor L domain-containing protein [Flavobacteriales bacterium]|nr:choice-of-anchor L domain-containing protein [Flavobacteriales bacterium]
MQDVNDCAVLGSTSLPTGDSLKFNFVFGSGYLEFVNSINDAFPVLPQWSWHHRAVQ